MGEYQTQAEVGRAAYCYCCYGENREAARVRSVSHAASGGVLDTGIDAGRISWGGWGGGAACSLLVFLSIIPIGRALVQKHWENLGENPRV